MTGRNRIKIITGLLFISFFAFAQNYPDMDSNKDTLPCFKGPILAKTFINPFPANNLQFYNDWSPGNIILENGTVIKNELLRYNAYLDELLWLRKSDFKQGVVNKQTVTGFTCINEENKEEIFFTKKRIKRWYLNDSSDVFLQVLVAGNVTLYSYRAVTYNSDIHDLENNEMYFISTNNGLQRFKPNRVSFLKLFTGEDKSKVKSILKNYRLKVADEGQLIEAIRIYNDSPVLKLKNCQ